MSRSIIEISRGSLPGDVCKSIIALECQESVRQKLATEPWEGEKRGCLLVFVLLVKLRHDSFRHKKDLGDDEDVVAIGEGCVGENRYIVDTWRGCDGDEISLRFISRD